MLKGNVNVSLKHFSWGGVLIQAGDEEPRTEGLNPFPFWNFLYLKNLLLGIRICPTEGNIQELYQQPLWLRPIIKCPCLSNKIQVQVSPLPLPMQMLFKFYQMFGRTIHGSPSTWVSRCFKMLSFHRVLYHIMASDGEFCIIQKMSYFQIQHVWHLTQGIISKASLRWLVFDGK